MKYMKLGSKPDAFQADGNDVRFIESELPTDAIVNVDDVKFYLHKFPLISKSKRLRRLFFRASEESNDEVHLKNLPGGSKIFEACAKFCYGMTVTLNAYNVVAARCAAEYLEMTEDVEKGNLIYKIEVFLNSSIFRSWKDSIIVLQTSKLLLPWSEDLKIVGRCIDSIASKTSVDPSNVNWSYSYDRKLALTREIVDHGPRLQQKVVPKDWWIEDISDLDIDLYKKVMVAIKAKGRLSADVLGEALRIYTIRWLPESIEMVSGEYAGRSRSLVETVICLLPSDKSSGCSCSFLLKLLKIVTLLGTEDSLKEELLNRISTMLHKASVDDLLIPVTSEDSFIYDINLVQDLVDRFLMKDGLSTYSKYTAKDEKADEFISIHASLLEVGKLIDGYLVEISCDPNIPLSSFIDLARSLPEAARPVHDKLYTAINIYLKEHPDLPKAEKKRVCSLMDATKLTPNACVHAVQNDRLPLRVVVQVLYSEQVRAMAGNRSVVVSDANREEAWEKPTADDYKALGTQMGNAKLEEGDGPAKEKIQIRSRGSRLLLPSRSRRIFDRLWTRDAQVENSKSSETSASSQSPPSASTTNPGESKSSGSSSRNRRHSVS